MSIFNYIGSTLPSQLSQLFLIIIINLILLTSSNLNKSLSDILYLNILMLFIYLVSLLIGFFVEKKKYSGIRLALNSGKSIDYLLPEDDTFYSKLLKDAVSYKTSQHQDLISKYKREMDELNNYITKWIHEVKIPITVSELAIENDAEIKIETSRKFKTELERIKFLVNQVLYAARSSHYQEDLTIWEFSLQKAVREALKLNSYFFMSKNIEIEAHSLKLNILSDEKWVIYILEQILNNASKYVPQDGKVIIYAEESSKSVILHIRDNGIGIPASDIPRLFDKGFTGENGRKVAKSTGMGLYYTNKIASRLGIRVEVDSSVNSHTEFILTFNKINDYLNVTIL